MKEKEWKPPITLDEDGNIIHRGEVIFKRLHKIGQSLVINSIDYKVVGSEVKDYQEFVTVKPLFENKDPEIVTQWEREKLDKRHRISEAIDSVIKQYFPLQERSKIKIELGMKILRIVEEPPESRQSTVKELDIYSECLGFLAGLIDSFPRDQTDLQWRIWRWRKWIETGKVIPALDDILEDSMVNTNEKDIIIHFGHPEGNPTKDTPLEELTDFKESLCGDDFHPLGLTATESIVTCEKCKAIIESGRVTLFGGPIMTRGNDPTQQDCSND